MVVLNPITHELRFILGLYPLTGLLTWLLHILYPLWFTISLTTAMALWIIYEDYFYLISGNTKLLFLFNVMGLLSSIDIYMLFFYGFPFHTNIYLLLSFVIYIIFGVWINIVSLHIKKKEKLSPLFKE